MADHQKALARGLHRAGEHVRSAPRAEDAAPDREPEEGSMLVSPAFWIAGGLCLLMWISVAAYFGWL